MRSTTSSLARVLRVFRGYQAEGTPGKPVRHPVFDVVGYSAHADQADLLNFAARCAAPGRPLLVRLVHGSEPAKAKLGQLVCQRVPGCRWCCRSGRAGMVSESRLRQICPIHAEIAACTPENICSTRGCKLMLSMLPVATGHSCRGFPLTNRAWTKSSSFVTKI